MPVVAVGEKDVLRFEVAVHDALLMGGAEGMQDWQQRAHCLDGREASSLRQRLREVLPIEQFHHNVRIPDARDAEVEHANDGGMP